MRTPVLIKQNVRLEVGTAHRCGVDDTIHAKYRAQSFTAFVFTKDAPVGGAHL